MIEFSSSRVNGQSTLYAQNPALARAVAKRTEGSADYAQAAQAAVSQLLGVKLEQEVEFPPGEAKALGMPQLSPPARTIGAADATLIMAMVMGLISDGKNASLEGKLQLLLVQQEGSRAKMKEIEEKKAEIAAQAEQAQKTMGCIGKILNAAVMALSIIGAAFTGGASLLLMGAMLVVTAVDKVVEKATGKSFMAEAMKPLMDKVIKPMVEAISKAISDVLKKCGVDEKTAQMVGAILSAVVAAVVVIAMVIGLKKLPIAAITKGLSKIVAKILPDFLKKFGAGLSSAQRSATSHLQNAFGGAERAKLMSNRIQTTALGGSVSNAGLQAAGDIYVGVKLKGVADLEADIHEAMAASKQLDKLRSAAAEVFEQFITMLSQNMRRLFDAAHRELDVGKSLLAMLRRLPA